MGGEETTGEEGCAAREKYGGNWTAENYKLLLSCFHWDTKTCFPRPPPFLPHLKRDIPAGVYQHVLTQPAWWLQAQSSSAILSFLHLSELIRMKMNSNLCTLPPCIPRGRDGKAAWWQGQGAVLSPVTSVQGLGICWEWHWAPLGTGARTTARFIITIVIFRILNLLPQAVPGTVLQTLVHALHGGISSLPTSHCFQVDPPEPPDPQPAVGVREHLLCPELTNILLPVTKALFNFTTAPP